MIIEVEYFVEDVTYEIINIEGKKIKSLKSTGNMTTMEIGDLPEGVYILSFRDELNKLIKSHNFFKNN